MPYPYAGSWSPNQSFRTAGMRRPGFSPQGFSAQGLGGMNIPNVMQRPMQPQPSPVMQMGAQLGGPPPGTGGVMLPPAPPPQAPIGTGGFMPSPVSPPMLPPAMGWQGAPPLATPQPQQVIDSPGDAQPQSGMLDPHAELIRRLKTQSGNNAMPII